MMPIFSGRASAGLAALEAAANPAMAMHIANRARVPFDMMSTSRSSRARRRLLHSTAMTVRMGTAGAGSGNSVVAASLLALLARAPVRADPAGNLILQEATIYTLDPARPRASALVIQHGRIAYVGDDAGARAFAGEGARTIALGGRMVLPGFHDSHIHPMTGGMRLLRCRLNECKDARNVYAAVRACAAAEPKGAWLLGGGWSPEVFAPRGPNRRKLDELVPDRPTLLTTEDGYTAWVNTSALASAGIHTDGSGPQVGGVERDPRTHRPTGVLKDDAVVFVRRHVPEPTQADYREALRRSTAIANRFGITSLVDANASETVLEAYLAAEMAQELTVRVVAAQRIDPGRGEEQIGALLERRERVRGRRVRSNAIKIFLGKSTSTRRPC